MRTSTAPDGGTVPLSLAKAAVIAALRDSYDHVLHSPSTAAVAHPNGFVKLPLALLVRDNLRLFLHVWLDETSETDIHDHRWDFSSVVLSGTLSNTRVEIAPAAANESAAEAGQDRLVVAEYRSSAQGFRLGIRQGSGVVVTDLRTSRLETGTHYHQPASALHTAGAMPGTMTFVARDAPMRPFSRVLRRGKISEVPTPWREVSGRLRRRLLYDALDRL